MPTYNALSRYALIMEKLSRRVYPSLNELQEYLSEHEHHISKRTLQRDIREIRYSFDVEIVFDQSRNGYFIDEEASLDVGAFLRYLKLATEAQLLEETLQESRQSLQYLSFETEGELRGVEHLKSLLYAIKNHRYISFTHHNYQTGEDTSYTIRPHLLKEYQNRWYVVGIVEDLEEYRTFGVDRIFDLEIQAKTFTPETGQPPKELFDQVVGLTYSYNDLEEIRLSLTPLQAKYLESLPLHFSQEVIEENKEEVIMRLFVIPNYEFQQKILMMGDQVEVLEPDWFREEIERTLEQSLQNYQ